jgi:excisionase family DNA binding protein
MAVAEIPRIDAGWLTTAEAAERRGWSLSAVQKWVAEGLLPAMLVGSGRNRTSYLLRVKDVDRFVPPVRGRPWPKKERPRR